MENQADLPRPLTETECDLLSSTYGSAGIARYRLAWLERQGYTEDSDQYKRILGRWQYLIKADLPEDPISLDYYNIEKDRDLARKAANQTQNAVITEDQ